MIRRSVFLASLVPAVLISWAAAPPVACAAAVQTTFCVAPNGRDDNPGTEAAPFATVERARQAVRTVNGAMAGDIVVVLRGGVYRIDRSIVFEPEDSGAGGHNVIYRAQPGETPILSGGRRVIGWQPGQKGRWTAPAPIADFRQLYVNGARATRARGKKPAGLALFGEDGYTTTAVEMANWKNPSDLEFCYLTTWAHTRCKVQSIRREGGRAIITMLQPYFTQAKTKEGVNILNPYPDRANCTYIENALELVDEPGQWHLDRPARTVYYLPRPGEDMAKAEVIVPALERLVELRGVLGRPVHNIQFEGIAFEHGGWLLPSKIGFVDVQANFCVDAKKPLNRNGVVSTLSNEYLKSPSNLACRAAKSIRFERCTFSKLGGGGIDLECGSQDNVIEGCRFYDISASAIQVGDVLKDDHHPDDQRKIVKNNAVVNNCIHDCGADYWGSVGVFAGYTDGTTIAHNEIFDLPYSGISVGWGWGEEDAGGGSPDLPQPIKYQTPTVCKDNHIEYNHIHGVMGKTDDGGGIYMLGNQPGSVIRGNYIHDCNNPLSRIHMARGIQLDQGSGFIEIVGNLVYRVNIPATFNNGVQNRLATCKVHDNFFGVDPHAAKSVVANAGLEPEYRDLLKQP